MPQERWQAFASADYKISDSVRVYGRVFAVNSSVPTQLASSAFFGGSTATFKVNLDNPFLTAAQRTALITSYNNEASFPIPGEAAHGVYNAAAAAGSQLVTVNGIRRRMIELGPRVGISESQTLQLTAGVDGDIGDSGWTWDVSTQWGRVSRLDGLENDVSIARAREALIAIQTPDGIKCVSGGSCAPVNIFSGNGAPYRDSGIPMTGAISQAGLDYIRASYYSSQTTEAHAASASVAGELGAFKLPTADAGLGLAFGVDWNENTSVYRPDDLTQFGGAMGQGGNSHPLKGRVDSTEVFAEAYLPLVTGKTGIQNLALDLGVRFSDTNLAGSFETWKAGLEYTPVEGYRFRTMLQKAVRAPNIGEQFAPASFGLTEVRTDPCAGSAPVSNTALRAKCIAQGAPQEILDNCFVNNLTSFCSLVRRNSVGELEGDGFGIVQDIRNLATINAEGIDYSLSYDFDVGDFDIGLGLAGTHTLDSSFQSSATSPLIECQGVYGDTCGNPTSEDRINLSASVGWKSLSATVFVRHLSAVDVQERADDPDQTGRSIYLIEKIPAVQYVDLSLQWRWNDALKVTLAAQNLLDEEPTIVGNIPGGNTAPNTYVDIYDPLGPKYSLGVTYKF